MVTPEAPVNVVKKAHDTSETIARPPGSQPRMACEKLTTRRDALLSAKIKPAKVKIGTV